MSDFSTRRAQWAKSVYDKAKSKSPERRARFVTTSGIERAAVDGRRGGAADGRNGPAEAVTEEGGGAESAT